jgi:hypothetical protein
VPQKWSIRHNANVTDLAFINHLVSTQGSLENAINWLKTEQPKADINAQMLASGQWRAPRYGVKEAAAGGAVYGSLAWAQRSATSLSASRALRSAPRTRRSTSGWRTATAEGQLDEAGVKGEPTRAKRKTFFRLIDDVQRELGRQVTAGDVPRIFDSLKLRTRTLATKINSGVGRA